jgi:hypothetical protein
VQQLITDAGQHFVRVVETAVAQSFGRQCGHRHTERARSAKNRSNFRSSRTLGGPNRTGANNCRRINDSRHQ